MTRIKRGNIARKRRKKILAIAKGFKGSHSKLFRTTNQQTMKAMQYAYFDRKKKKRFFKIVWIRRINAIAKQHDISYNKFIHKLKEQKILINRKILAEIILKDTKTIIKLFN